MSLGIFFVLSLLFRGSQSARAGVRHSSLPLEMLQELKDALDRQCVVAHAVEFSKFFPDVKCLTDGEPYSNTGSNTKDLLATGPQTLDNGTTLPELVADYYEGVKLGKIWEGRISEMLFRNEAKAKIERRCFSISAAHSHCYKYRATDVRDALAVECIAKKLQLTSPDKILLYRRYLLAQREATMWTWHTKTGGVRKERRRSATKARRLLRKLNRKTSYAQFKTVCHQDTSEHQLRANEDVMIQRMVDENDKCTEGDDSKRSDSHDDHCPEASMCDKRRKPNPERGKKVFRIAFVGSFPIFAGLGALAAFSLPGVTLAAGASSASGLGSPLRLPLAYGMSYLFSTDLRSSWSCFPATCELDASRGQCTLLGVSPFNRFGWLPPLGQKCVMGTEDKPMCKMSLCSLVDYSGPQHKVNFALFGKIGRHGSDLYNCLSKAGSISSGLELAESLPSGERNTAQNRVSLYTLLSVRRDGVTSG
eukprot:TRINITY_DN26358_c0_g3_i1.p1 TRINITY_DN26358_c0_g3~~TRINITY_DN26358_c0_g3_i1.p1  ORF type:complete len:478 (-),score=34.57 TRINITY_DN26358_c0_g3_i1:103-1536(-)